MKLNQLIYVQILIFMLFHPHQTLNLQVLDFAKEKMDDLNRLEKSSIKFKCMASCMITKKQPPIIPLNFVPVFQSLPRNLSENNSNQTHRMTSYCKRKSLAGKFDTHLIGKRFFFFAYQKVTWFLAEKECRAAGMNLGSVDTKVKQRAIAAFVSTKAFSYNLGGASKGPLELWNGALNLAAPAKGFYLADDGANAEAHRKPLDKKLVKPGCSYISGFKNNTVILSEEICKKDKIYFCEPSDMCYDSSPCTLPTCPIATCAVQNRTLSMTEAEDRKKKLRETYSFIPTFQIKTKEKDYYMSKIKATYAEAAEMCCSLFGFHLLSLEKPQELQAVANSMTIGNKKGIFWTSGFNDPSCNSNYLWCSSGSVFANVTSWLRGEPSDDKSETCVALNVRGLDYGDSKNVLSNENCSQKLNFVCEEEYLNASAVTSNAAMTLTQLTSTSDSLPESSKKNNTEDPENYKREDLSFNMHAHEDCLAYRLDQYFCIARCISYVRDSAPATFDTQVFSMKSCIKPNNPFISTEVVTKLALTSTTVIVDTRVSHKKDVSWWTKKPMATKVMTTEGTTEVDDAEEEVTSEVATTAVKIVTTSPSKVATKTVKKTVETTTTEDPEDEDA